MVVEFERLRKVYAGPPIYLRPGKNLQASTSSVLLEDFALPKPAARPVSDLSLRVALHPLIPERSKSKSVGVCADGEVFEKYNAPSLKRQSEGPTAASSGVEVRFMAQAMRHSANISNSSHPIAVRGKTRHHFLCLRTVQRQARNAFQNRFITK